MTRVLVTRLCYLLVRKADVSVEASCFSKMSELTHDRFGPFPYSEFGSDKTWNPANKHTMIELFDNITNGVCLMLKRKKAYGDVAVISDGEWQTYGIVTDRKKGGKDDDYELIKKPKESFGFLKVGDGYFMLHNPKIIQWVKHGDAVYDKR